MSSSRPMSSTNGFSGTAQGEVSWVFYRLGYRYLASIEGIAYALMIDDREDISEAESSTMPTGLYS
jgi:hypothetical protein